MKIQDFWAITWDRQGNKSLPLMYTVFYKGMPVMDTPNPERWIKEQFDE